MVSQANRISRQARPPSSAAVTLYTLPTNTEMELRSIFVTNTAGASAKFSIFADNTGTTYDETTAVIWEVELSNNESFIVNVTTDAGIINLNTGGGTIGVQTDTGNALTFSIYGTEFT